MRARGIPSLTLVLLLAACGTQTPPVSSPTAQETQVTTSERPTDPRAAATSHREEAARHLDAVHAMFDPTDDQEFAAKRSASTAACTAGGPGSSLAWLDRGSFALAQDPEPAVEAAARRLEAEGWSRVEQANAGHQVTLEREGWLTVLSWIPDVRVVTISAESPCEG